MGKLPLHVASSEVELSGMFPPRGSHEEVAVHRDADRVDSQTAHASVPVKEVCRQAGISVPIYYKWKSKCGGLKRPSCCGSRIWSPEQPAQADVRGAGTGRGRDAVPAASLTGSPCAALYAPIPMSLRICSTSPRLPGRGQRSRRSSSATSVSQ